MPRIKRSVASRARRKKILKAAKGYYGARSRTFKVAKQAVIKAGQYAYRDRRQRKRQFRRLWIVRINAAAREHGLPTVALLRVSRKQASRWIVKCWQTLLCTKKTPSLR
jgi:ribosomal protein L20